MTIEEQFKAILQLQEEIDQKVDQYIEMIKAIPERSNQRVIVELDGLIYELRKVDETTQVMNLCHKHRGFFHDYRLLCLGKPLR